MKRTKKTVLELLEEEGEKAEIRFLRDKNNDDWKANPSAVEKLVRKVGLLCLIVDEVVEMTKYDKEKGMATFKIKK